MMTQWVKAFATEPEDPSLTARTQMVDRENRLCPLPATHMPWHAYATHITYKINKQLKSKMVPDLPPPPPKYDLTLKLAVLNGSLAV